MLAGRVRAGAVSECGARVMLVEEGPEWRNWQTRWTQNPVVLSTVWVRPPPPGPPKFQIPNKLSDFCVFVGRHTIFPGLELRGCANQGHNSRSFLGLFGSRKEIAESPFQASR